MLELRHPCCGLGLLTIALACQPPTPALRCSDDSDCPTDFVCDLARRYCSADPLARGDWRLDSGSRDSAAPHDGATGDRQSTDAAQTDAGPGVDHPHSDTGSAADGAHTDAGSGIDRAQPDVQLADTAQSDRQIRDFSVSIDGLTIIDVIVADLPKTDRAGGVDSGAIDAGPNTDAGSVDACDCIIDGGCHAAMARNPTNACLWCDPYVPNNWSTADGEVCWGNLCTGARICLDGLCDTFTTMLNCTFSCDVVYQQCCGEIYEPCCTSYTPCTSGTRCIGVMPGAHCEPSGCGSSGQPCCGLDICDELNVCNLGSHLCVPCGANQQWCCNGVDCGNNHACDNNDTCYACGRVNQLCCPGNICTGGAPACCTMVWPKACTSPCG